jgi:hypothetical protein
MGSKDYFIINIQVDFLTHLAFSLPICICYLLLVLESVLLSILGGRTRASASLQLGEFRRDVCLFVLTLHSSLFNFPLQYSSGGLHHIVSWVGAHHIGERVKTVVMDNLGWKELKELVSK